MAEGARRYTFHPLERRGLLLGLDAGQILTLIAGLAIAVVVGHELPGPAGVGAAACLLAASAVGALWPPGAALSSPGCQWDWLGWPGDRPARG